MTAKILRGKTLTIRPGRRLGSSAPRPTKCAPSVECEECEGACTEDVVGAAFYNFEDTHIWDLDTVAFLVDFYTGGRLGADWYPYVPTTYWVALAGPVNADGELAELCDCEGGVSWEWTNLLDWIGKNAPTIKTFDVFAMVTAGPEQRVDAGTVELTPTICGVEYDPLVVTISEYGYGS